MTDPLTTEDVVSDVDLRELIRSYSLMATTNIQIPFREQVLDCLRELLERREECGDCMVEITEL